MTLLAAPIIRKFPAIVLPAAKAILAVRVNSADLMTGIYKVTNGTLEIIWLAAMLKPIIELSEFPSGIRPADRFCKSPFARRCPSG